MKTEDTMRTTQPAKFDIGHKVYMPTFVDCFGKTIPQTAVLIVTRVNLVRSDYPDGLAPYYRVLAYGPNHESREAAERFFEFSPSSESSKYGMEPCAMCCNRGHYPIGTTCPQCNGAGWITNCEPTPRLFAQERGTE